jgi:hypothetical protein
MSLREVAMIRSQVRQTATASATVTSWDETRYDAPDGSRRSPRPSSG